MVVASHEEAVEKFGSAVGVLESKFSETNAAAASHAARDAWSELYETMIDVGNIKDATLAQFENILKKCDTAYVQANVDQYPEGFKWVNRIRWYLDLLGIFKTSGIENVHQAIEEKLAGVSLDD